MYGLELTGDNLWYPAVVARRHPERPGLGAIEELARKLYYPTPAELVASFGELAIAHAEGHIRPVNSAMPESWRVRDRIDTPYERQKTAPLGVTVAPGKIGMRPRFTLETSDREGRFMAPAFGLLHLNKLF